MQTLNHQLADYQSLRRAIDHAFAMLAEMETVRDITEVSQLLMG